MLAYARLFYVYKKNRSLKIRLVALYGFELAEQTIRPEISRMLQPRTRRQIVYSHHQSQCAGIFILFSDVFFPFICHSSLLDCHPFMRLHCCAR